MHLVSNHLNIHSVTNRKSANIGFEQKSFENAFCSNTESIRFSGLNCIVAIHNIGLIFLLE